MLDDIFIYIGSICGAIFYVIEIYTARETYQVLYIAEKIQDNKRLNYYSIRLRLCNIVYDFSMLCYNYLNGLISPTIAFSVYFCMDFIILCIRIYYAYVLQYKFPSSALLIKPMRTETCFHMHHSGSVHLDFPSLGNSLLPFPESNLSSNKNVIESPMHQV
jgi:hypothetical protein